MTQRLATTTQAHSDATKKSQGCSEENSTINEGYGDSKTWNRRHEENRQLLEEQFSKRRSVSKAKKSEYRFYPDLTPYLLHVNNNSFQGPFVIGAFAGRNGPQDTNGMKSLQVLQ